MAAIMVVQNYIIASLDQASQRSLLLNSPIPHKTVPIPILIIDPDINTLGGSNEVLPDYRMRLSTWFESPIFDGTDQRSHAPCIDGITPLILL